MTMNQKCILSLCSPWQTNVHDLIFGEDSIDIIICAFHHVSRREDGFYDVRVSRICQVETGNRRSKTNNLIVKTGD